jgi:hypothetical protein
MVSSQNRVARDDLHLERFDRFPDALIELPASALWPAA